MHNIFSMLCFIISRKVKTQLKRKKQICAVYGEGAVTDGMCQKWFVKFCAGDFSLDDAPWVGRPVEVDSDQITTLIENNQHSAMWEIAGIFQISKSIKLLVKMKNMSFILQENHTDFLGQPNIYHSFVKSFLCQCSCSHLSL